MQEVQQALQQYSWQYSWLHSGQLSEEARLHGGGRTGGHLWGEPQHPGARGVAGGQRQGARPDIVVVFYYVPYSYNYNKCLAKETLLFWLRN